MISDIKNRYENIEPLLENIDFNKFPLILQILAETYFWLDDIKECYKLLKILLTILKNDDHQLQYILSMLKELIDKQVIDDDFFYNNEGEDRIDGILYKYYIVLLISRKYL